MPRITPAVFFTERGSRKNNAEKSITTMGTIAVISDIVTGVMSRSAAANAAMVTITPIKPIAKMISRPLRVIFPFAVNKLIIQNMTKQKITLV